MHTLYVQTWNHIFPFAPISAGDVKCASLHNTIRIPTIKVSLGADANLLTHRFRINDSEISCKLDHSCNDSTRSLHIDWKAKHLVIQYNVRTLASNSYRDSLCVLFFI